MALPDALKVAVSQEDQAMLVRQLQALPEGQAQQVLFALQNLMARQRVDNPLGWMLAVMKKPGRGLSDQLNNRNRFSRRLRREHSDLNNSRSPRLLDLQQLLKSRSETM